MFALRMRGRARRVPLRPIICSLLLLPAGCPQPGGGNNAPEANAGADQTVDAGATVTLNGSASSDPDGDAISFSWKQMLGTPVSLSSTSEAVVTFTAPTNGTNLTFEVIVSDGQSNAVGKTSVAVRLVDSSVQVEERIQRSVSEDPAVLGDFPKDWLIPEAGAGLPPPPTQEDPVSGSEPELSEFVEKFEGVKVHEAVQEELLPGATRTMSLEIDAPSGLSGLAQWIGTTSPLEVTIALDGNTLATGSTYSMGHDRGGSYVNSHTETVGSASFSVRNTTDTTVIVRMSFAARAIGEKPEVEP